MANIPKKIENDRYGIGEEKIEWLKEIGADEIKEPYVYSVFNENVGFPDQLFSVKYLQETPLEELKKRFNETTRRSDEWDY